MDWYLARLAMVLHTPSGGVVPPLLPAHARNDLDFRDLLELHLLMDLEESRIAASIKE